MANRALYFDMVERQHKSFDVLQGQQI
jgi:hypothetical protein